MWRRCSVPDMGAVTSNTSDGRWSTRVATRVDIAELLEKNGDTESADLVRRAQARGVTIQPRFEMGAGRPPSADCPRPAEFVVSWEGPWEDGVDHVGA